MTRRAVVLCVALAVVLPTLGGYAIAARADASSGDPPLGPGAVTIELDTNYSHFSRDHIRVYEGTLVTFIVTNLDPIRHEFIVGTDDVHAAHEAGSEQFHPPIPGEVTLDPGDRGLTAYLFDQPGTLRYECHLPGHLAYGMKGTVTVVPTP